MTPSEPAPTRPHPSPPSATPAGSVCIRCGYDLTGLDPAGTCPECGTEIARSLRGDLLADADPDWLRLVSRGLWFLAWGPVLLVVGCIGLILFMVLGVTAAATDAPDGLVGGLLSTLGMLVVGSLGIGLLAGAVGAVLLTMVEPRDAHETRLQQPRYLARWGPVGALVFAAVAAFLEAHLIGTWGPVTHRGLVALAVVSGGLGLAALHRHLRSLADRVPSPSLSVRCTEGADWFRKMTLFATVVIVLSGVREVMVAFPAMDGVRLFLDLFVAFGSCATFVIAILAFFRLLRLLNLASSLRTAIRASLVRAAASDLGSRPSDPSGGAGS